MKPSGPEYEVKKEKWMAKALRMGCPYEDLEAAWIEACENDGVGT